MSNHFFDTHPNINTVYWYVDDYGVIQKDIEQGDKIDKFRFDINNYFVSEEAAKFELEKLKVEGELAHLARIDLKKNDSALPQFLTQVRDGRKSALCWIEGMQYSKVYQEEMYFGCCFYSSDGWENAIKQVGEKRIAKYLFNANVEV